MNQPGKLDTVVPAMRSATSLTPPPIRGRETEKDDPQTKSQAPADSSFFIETERSRPVPIASNVSLNFVSGASEAAEPPRFSKRYWLAMMPSWSVSLVGHVALIVMLAIIVANPPKGPASVRLDARLVDAGEAMEEDLPATEMETESNVLEVDLAALNSEASPETSDVFHDTGVDVSLMEGLSTGDAMDGLASSGLTPIEVADSGGISGNDGNAASFFGTKAGGSRFIFIIDFSDSMNEGFRWQRALMELEKAIEGLTSKEQALVLLYNFETFPMFGTAPKELKLASVTKEFKTSLKRWLKTQRPFGGTRPAHAIEYSLSLKPDAIFLLSDGLLADNSLEVVAELNRFKVRDSTEEYKIPIHTISLGPDARGAEVMKFIADTNDGSFNWVQ